MSEESKITTVGKVKNPGRVAAGKRLAAISKEAKARKNVPGTQTYSMSP